MILPIVAYGVSTLKKSGVAVSPNDCQLPDLIRDMWQTLDHADGVGLAAPQVNKNWRLFIVDSAKVYRNLPADEVNKHPDAPGIRKVFINASILHYSETKTTAEEGCLSIPDIYIPVERAYTITIRYADELFHEYTETFHGHTARMIQHEYDHTQGKLHIDYLPPLQRILLRNKLENIRKGKKRATYPMLFASTSK